MAKINAARVIDKDIPLSRKLCPHDICVVECDRLHNCIGLWIEQGDGEYDSLLVGADLAGWIMLDSPVGRRLVQLMKQTQQATQDEDAISIQGRIHIIRR